MKFENIEGICKFSKNLGIVGENSVYPIIHINKTLTQDIT